MNSVLPVDAFPHGTLAACYPDQFDWMPWAMKGSQFKLLSVVPEAGRFTLLLKVSKDVVAPVHKHVGAVEVFVLEGDFHYVDAPDIRFTAGSYLLEDAGAVHQPASLNGAVMVAVFHGPVEGLDSDGNVVGRIDWKWHADKWQAAEKK
jgi:2,4'-dihydroxyacetophenone dioxygenase